MYNVLLPVDTEIELALGQAEYIKSIPCASDDFHVIIAHPLINAKQEIPEEMEQAGDLDPIRQIANTFEYMDISSEYRRLSQSPPEGIINIVESEMIDEVVMAGRKRSPVMKAVLGDITQRVILNTSVPVTVTGSI